MVINSVCGVCVCACVDGRQQRSGRQSDSRLTEYWCNCSKRLSRKPSISQSHQIYCVCKTLLCWPCRTCSPGLKTPPRSVACPPVSRASSIVGTHPGCGQQKTSVERRSGNPLIIHHQTVNTQHLSVPEVLPEFLLQRPGSLKSISGALWSMFPRNTSHERTAVL